MVDREVYIEAIYLVVYFNISFAFQEVMFEEPMSNPCMVSWIVPMFTRILDSPVSNRHSKSVSKQILKKNMVQVLKSINSLDRITSSQIITSDFPMFSTHFNSKVPGSERPGSASVTSSLPVARVALPGCSTGAPPGPPSQSPRRVSGATEP